MSSPRISLRQPINRRSLARAIIMILPITAPIPRASMSPRMRMVPHIYPHVIARTIRVRMATEVFVVCEGGQGHGGEGQAQEARGDYLTSHEGTSTPLRAIILTVPFLSRAYQLSRWMMRPWSASPWRSTVRIERPSSQDSKAIAASG